MTNEDRNEMGLKLVQRGLALHKGLETGSPDPDAAIPWYAKAARLGSLPAMNSLGEIYLEKKDYGNAYYWFLEAAMGGEANSLYHLGDLCCKGIYVHQDPEKAYRYFERAYG